MDCGVRLDKEQVSVMPMNSTNKKKVNNERNRLAVHDKNR